MNSVIISMKDLKYNIEKIKEYASTNLPDDNGNKVKIIAVVKLNAYGLGSVEYTKFLIDNGIDYFAVAEAKEALNLRKAGIEADILLLSPITEEDEAKELVENNIILTISSKESSEIVDKIGQELNKKIRVHLKIDTGFGRYGFVYSKREEMIQVLKEVKNIEIEGTFTHFSSSYYNDKYTKLQFERFINCVEVLKMNEIKTGILHVCNTSAFIKFPNMHLNAVRIGSAFIGRVSSKNSLGLKKVGYLKSNVVEIKKVPKGFYIGYSNAYKTKKELEIAIIPCGQQGAFNMDMQKDMFRMIDKIRYMLHDIKNILKKQKLTVNINGQECTVLGRVGTCHITVDITGKDIKINDEVILHDKTKFIDSSIRREWY